MYRLQLEVRLQEDRLAEARRLESTFILLTNAPGLSLRDALLEYKGQQTAVEIPFRTLKDLPVSPIFAKTPRRVEALTWVILMAYLLYALLQYRVRQAILQRERPLRSPVRKKDMRPTGRSILDMLLTIQTVRIRLPDGSITRQFASSNQDIFDLLELLRIPKEVFITVPGG